MPRLDEIYENVRRYFSEEELIKLTLAIGRMPFAKLACTHGAGSNRRVPVGSGYINLLGQPAGCGWISVVELGPWFVLLFQRTARG